MWGRGSSRGSRSARRAAGVRSPCGCAGNTGCCVLAGEWDHTCPCTLQELYAEPVIKSLQAWRSELKQEAVKS